MSDRVILHCDLNSFYASVECLYDPKLRNVPMAVCNDSEDRKGVILAKNDLAKKAGVKTAQSLWEAKRKCPELVCAKPRRERYIKYHMIVNDIYKRYTDLVEPYGIDESWLDVTGSLNLFGSGKEIADKLRNVVKSETGLTISVGVSYNKIFAKLGSDIRKPDATTVISKENFKQIVYPLPVSALLFVGKVSQDILNKMNIFTIGQLAEADPFVLAKKLGQAGEQIYEYALGINEDEVARASEPSKVKSVGNGRTFRRNLVNRTDVLTAVAALSDMTASRLRQAGMKCMTVQIMIKDPLLKMISRQKTLKYPVQTAKEISEAAMAIIDDQWDYNKPIRMISITGANLVTELEPEQISLFEGENIFREKIRKVEKTLDVIREKYGTGSVKFGSVIGNDLGIDDFEEDER